MARRRDLLRFGIAASLWPLARATAAVPRHLPASSDLSAFDCSAIDCIVYDRRYAAGLAVAQRAATLGLAAQAIDGDVSALWYDDLRLRARQRPPLLAGLTTGPSLFCLCEFARDANLRLRYHDVQRADGRLDAGDLDPTVGWAAALASDQPPELDLASLALGQGTGTPDLPTLHSWLIGPTATRLSR